QGHRLGAGEVQGDGAGVGAGGDDEVEFQAAHRVPVVNQVDSGVDAPEGGVAEQRRAGDPGRRVGAAQVVDDAGLPVGAEGGGVGVAADQLHGHGGAAAGRGEVGGGGGEPGGGAA